MEELLVYRTRLHKLLFDSTVESDFGVKDLSIFHCQQLLVVVYRVESRIETLSGM